MPDYQALIESCAKELGAEVVDIRSEQALSEEFDQILQSMLNDFTPEMAAFSNTHTRKIYIVLPIETEYGFAVAMHELGHIAKTEPGTAPTLESESIASQWALDHATFGPEGARALQDGIESYAAEPEYGRPGPVTGHVRKELHGLLRQT